MKAIRQRTGRRSEEGSTLMLAVIPMIILSVALAASMQLAASRSKMAVRSQAWNVSLTMSEAGIEEAMAHLNYTEGVNLARFGWTYTGSGYYKSNTLGEGSYTVTISTNFSPSITAQGYSRMPAAALLAVAGGGQSVSVEQKVRRNVEVTTKRVPPAIGLVSRGKMTVQNDFDVDSYDSSDPNFSGVGGIYASNRAKANGFVGTISTTANDMLVKDNADIRGNIGAAAVNVIRVDTPASVGDATFVNGGSTGVQGGHQQNNLVATIPNFTVPFSSGAAPGAGSFGGTNYNWRLTNGNYRMNSLTVGNGQKMIVTGKARLHVTGQVYVQGTGFIKIEPGASLELYVGQQLYVQGNGRINFDGTPDRFMCVGLGTLAEAYLQDNAFVSGVIHTPQAKLDMSSNAQLCGAGNANEIVLQGFADFHFDEALSTTREGVFQITSWTEK